MLKHLKFSNLFFIFVMTQLSLGLLAFTNDSLINSTAESDGIELFGSLSEKNTIL